MAVTKARKNEILENLKESIKNAKSVSFTTNSGLTVEEITNLRINLREVNSTFTLAKKTLIKIAFKEVHNIEIDDSILVGQIAVVCSNDDAVSAMGKVNEFIKWFKKDPKVAWAWSFFEWEVKNAEDTTVIASIPSRETLLGRLVWSMQSPIAWLARFFDAAAKKLDEEGKANLWSAAPAKKEEPKVEASAPVVEEQKTEETPVVELKEEVASSETPTEEVKTEVTPA